MVLQTELFGKLLSLGHSKLCYAKILNIFVVCSIVGWNPDEYVDTHSKYDWYDGEEGKVKWAQGCDFKGNDFSCVTSVPQLCGRLCVDDSRCTHFTYYYGNGTCCLKTAPKSAEVSPLDAVCGQLLEKFPPFPST